LTKGYEKQNGLLKLNNKKGKRLLKNEQTVTVNIFFKYEQKA
jgi:hypothetical protein